MKNKIQDLRNHLFELLEDLKDPEGKMSLDRAKAINDTAQTIINTAKVELQYLDLVGGKGTDFIPVEEDGKQPGIAPPAPRLRSIAGSKADE